MKTKFTMILIGLLFLWPIFSFGQYQVSFKGGAEWEFKKQTKGMKVYTRDVEGTLLKELKFTININASLSNIVAVLLDVEGYKNWVYKCTTSDNIQKPNRSSSYDYYVADFPWPLSDRDLYVFSSLRQDPKTKIVTADTHSLPDYRPDKTDLVRVIHHENQWILKPIGHNLVELTYYLRSDPSGNIPIWLVNMVIDQGPVKSMKKFQRLLTLDKYKFQKFDFIENY